MDALDVLEYHAIAPDEYAEVIVRYHEAALRAKRAGKGRSMSFTEVVNGPRQTAPSTIDWNELARTAPVEPAAPVVDTTPTEADE